MFGLYEDVKILGFLSAPMYIEREGYAYENGEETIKNGGNLCYALLEIDFAKNSSSFRDYENSKGKYPVVYQLELMENPKIVYDGLKGKNKYKGLPVFKSFKEIEDYLGVSGDAEAGVLDMKFLDKQPRPSNSNEANLKILSDIMML